MTDEPMKPYYERGGITIFCGDCLEVMPRLDMVFDLCLTDPPHGINGGSGTINKNRDKGHYDSQFADTPNYIKSLVVPIIKRLIEICTGVIVTPGNKNFILYPQPVSLGCFYQPAAVGLQVFGNGDMQPIFYYGKNPTKKNMGVPCSYEMVEVPEKNGHPCVKPIRVWTKMLRNFSLKNHFIIDPFMGSGTTLLAAQNAGRQCLGIELSEEYCKIAVDRLRQPSFFSIPDKPKPVEAEQLELIK